MTTATSDPKAKEAKPAATVVKKTIIEEDDAFEDFPAQDYDAKEGEQPQQEDENAWQDSYEDDDETVDFHVLLQKEKENLQKGVEPMRM